MKTNTGSNRARPIYTPGTKFKVCTHEELLDKGWVMQTFYGKVKLYEHVDFKKGGVITYTMIDNCQGQTLTIIGASINFVHWYYVKENPNIWPAETFIEDTKSMGCTASNIIGEYLCVEGMTPIDGWFICKNCGHNLREIK